MGRDWKVCDVCFALVEESHLVDHKGWHRTMSNMPPREEP